MKKTLALLVIAAASFGCSYIERVADRARFGANPYEETPFYTRYLNPSDPRDAQILLLIEVLRENPGNAAAHNELGGFLAAKGFPNDAEREFLRAIAADRRFYPAWYNLATVREGEGRFVGAVQALRQTLELKRGHAEAHFQLGLIYEQQGRTDDAIHHYAQAFKFNRGLLDIRKNPRIVDTNLVEAALLKLYPTEHARRIVRYQTAPADYVPPEIPEPQPAPSEQPSPRDIVTPAPPVTEPSQQPSPPPTGV